MIVYRDQRHRADPRALVEELRSDLEGLRTPTPGFHDRVVRALISAGTLETGVADAVFLEADDIDPMVQGFRRATVALGHLLWHSWHDDAERCDRWRCRALDSLRHLELQRLPQSVELTTPEGFAHYAVYPEAYLEAARQSHRLVGSPEVVCIGIRSIGTTLSAIVAAGYEELGYTVHPITLRPRGHPFCRRPRMTSRLERELRAPRHAVYLLVDEGPGISGSSLGGTAAMLTELGVSDERVVIFPSYHTDGSRLRSPEARQHWQRHQRFVVDFDELWLRSGRMSFGAESLSRFDWSAGAWRKSLYPDGSPYPPAHPQHERRKYLVPDNSAKSATLFKFFGLTPAADRKMERAACLGDAGFTPVPCRLERGFLSQVFVPGTPVRRGDADEALLESAAGYLAHLYREHRSDSATGDEALREMTLANVAEELGADAARLVTARLPSTHESWCAQPVALDGRAQAHEWIKSGSRYFKTDAFDHHDDHFFPGCQDIAWDLAGAVFEFDLEAPARSFLLQRYRSLSGDGRVGLRLPHYALAYLAFRVGYCRLATETLAGTPDGDRFIREAARYRTLLGQELEPGSEHAWHA